MRYKYFIKRVKQYFDEKGIPYTEDVDALGDTYIKTDDMVIEYSVFNVLSINSNQFFVILDLVSRECHSYNGRHVFFDWMKRVFGEYYFKTN